MNDLPRRTARGKIVGSYKLPSDRYYVATHPSGKAAVHYPSGALKSLHESETDANLLVQELNSEWLRISRGTA